MNQAKYQTRYYLPIWFFSLITSLFPDNKYTIRIRGIMIGIFLPGRPKNLTIGRDVTLLGVNQLFVGNNVYIAKGSWINAKGKIKIEDEVVIAPYNVIVSTAHGFKNNSVRWGGTHFAPVTIGKGTWIASHCTIAAGSTIGSGCLIGANSMVSGSFHDNSFVGGVPAKFIKIRQNNPGV